MSTNITFKSDDFKITEISNLKLLRITAKLLPLGHRLFPLVRQYKRPDGLLSIPVGKFNVLYPNAWLNPFTATLIFNGAKGYGDFFVLFEGVLKNLKSGTIIDVGANIGEWVVLMRSFTKLPIVAYEPSPYSVEVMKRAIDYNNFTDVDVRGKACGNASGSVELNVGIVSNIKAGNDSGPHSEQLNNCTEAVNETCPSVNVEVVALDQDLKSIEKIGLLKIDCEGYEYDVLAGAKDIIVRHQPILYLELHPGQIESFGHSTEEVIDLLQPYYNMEFYGRNGRYKDAAEVLTDFEKNTAKDHKFGYPIGIQAAVIGYPKS